MSPVNFTVRLHNYFPLAQFLLVILFLYSNSTKGQENIRFNHLTSHQGLTSNFANCLVKDNSGFLWIGTKEGINRFDGKNITSFTHEIGNDASLINNEVLSMFPDSKNHLWIATRYGLSIFFPETSDFHSYRELPALHGSIDVSEDVRTINEKDGHILICTNHNLISSSKDSMLFKVRLTLETKKGERPYFFIPNGIIHVNSQTWILTSRGPLLTKDLINFYSKSNNPLNLDILNEKWISSMIYDGNSSLYFGKFHSPALYCYHLDSNTFDTISFPAGIQPSLMSFSTVMNDEIWGATLEEGAFKLNIHTHEIQFFHHNNMDLKSISSSQAFYVIQDEEGTVFIGTDQGVSYASAIQPPFNTFNITGTPLMEKRFAIGDSQDGLLWLSSLGEGIFSFNRNTGKIMQYKLPGDGNTIWSMANYEQGFLLSTASGLGIFNTQTKKFKLIKIPEVLNVEFKQHSTFIHVDRKGHIWLGFYLNGIINYDPFTGQFIRFNVSDTLKPLPRAQISSFTSDSLDHLWIGYLSNDITQINTVDNSVYNFKVNMDNQYERPGIIESIQIDGSGHLWIATSLAGIFKYNLADSTFVNYNTKNKLSHNLTGSLTLDNDNHLWFSTPQGLNKFDPATEEFTLYNSSDGLNYKESDFNPNFISRDGYIYVLSKYSISWFNPKGFPSNSSIPKLYLINYQKSGEIIIPDPNDHGISLSYQDKMITFNYVGINFIDPTKTQYAYFLENFDNTWNYPGNQPNATYSSLPPGDYTLHIKATNKPNSWDVPETLMNVHVSGPLWRKWWFITSCCCLGLAVIYSVNQYRFAQFKKILSIRNKISKDLHDDIGSTLSSISICSSAVEQMKADRFPEIQSAVSTIGQSARTAMENMSDIVWAIHPGNDTFKNMMDRLQIFAVRLLEARDIQLQFEIPEALQTIKLSMPQRKNIYLILREAIHNVAKYSGATHCIVSAKMENRKIDLEVKDDGHGFGDLQPGLGGNGLMNMRERAEELNAHFQINTEKEKGTSVSIQFAYT